MSSIGPQLPPHLSKRKRSPSESSSALPSKIANTNVNEVDTDASDSDDGFGPRAHAQDRSATLTKVAGSSIVPSIGLRFPPTEQSISNKDEINLDDDSDSDSGPQLASAPKLSAPRGMGPTLPPSTRIMGPTMPPDHLDQRSTTNKDESDVEPDSDDDYGPALPGTLPSIQQQAHLRDLEAAEAAAATAPKRDDWMLAPPLESGTRTPDTTKLKSRGFNSSRNDSSNKSEGVSSIWTEMPEEKKRRMENAMFGRTDKSAFKQGKPTKSSADIQKEEEQRRKIEKYTQQTRGKSLYEQRQETLKKGNDKHDAIEEDDPSKRAFDIQKDMAIGGRLGESQKREILKKASNFGDRFQKGSYL